MRWVLQEEAAMNFRQGQMLIDHLLIIANRSQDEKLKHLEHAVKLLYRLIGSLFGRLSEFQHDHITLSTGNASIVLKKDGTIQIKGTNIIIEGSGPVVVKSGSDLTLKGARILQN
jgi:hypothetical protein